MVLPYQVEKKPLKRPKLGPPDVYPQEIKQKEDELTPVNVKQGFTPAVQIPNEHGSAKDSNITAAKFGSYFSGILSKKHELNTFQDSNSLGRKKQQINPKDHFWPVTARSQSSIETWFKDLAGSKALTYLAKKVPIFNKKEEIFTILHKYMVPACRAAWYIKMCSAYTVAISEAKIKKRQLTDPSIDWTMTLCKFMKEQFIKLTNYYQTNANVTSTTTTSTTTTITKDAEVKFESECSLKLWQYCNQLARFMFEDGLLDKHEFLQWLLELMEKSKSSDDGVLKLIMPVVVQYADEYVYSEYLSRRLCTFCCKKINQLCTEMTNGGLVNNTSTGGIGTLSPRTQSPIINVSSNQVMNSINNNGVNNNSNLSVPSSQASHISNSQTPAVTPSLSNPVLAAFVEFSSCPHHRNILLCLSAIIQIVTMECPTALVWNNIGETKHNSVLNGSPLDYLPCPPSCLPMPPSPDNMQIRTELKVREHEIRHRGRAAEGRWSSDKWQKTTAGCTTSKILSALDVLDKHSFEKVESANSLDSLYAKLFTCKDLPGAASGTQSDSVSNQDEHIVHLLCQWAVTTQRSGEHRALVVAKLLEKRQSELSNEKFMADENAGDEKDSNVDMMMSSAQSNVPIFHDFLLNFLDDEAPVLDGTCSDDYTNSSNKKSFANLILLFSELIRYDVFSHDLYMCTLISRGCLSNENNITNFNAVQPITQPSTPQHCLSSGMKSTAVAPDGLPPVGHLSNSGEHQKMLSGNMGAVSSASSLQMHLSHQPHMVSSHNMDGLQHLHQHQHQTHPLHHTHHSSGNMIKQEFHLPSESPAHQRSMFGNLMDTQKAIPKHEPHQQHNVIDPSMDDSKIDDDLGVILQHIKEGQQHMMDPPDSVGSDKELGGGQIPFSHPLNGSPTVGGQQAGAIGGYGGVTGIQPSRHLQYMMHVPLPQDDTSSHDCNQRNILLYGVGKSRDEVTKGVKKMIKEITKLFGKKSSLDITKGVIGGVGGSGSLDITAKTKKYSKEYFDSLSVKFQNLCYYDQHLVSSCCAAAVLDMLQAFSTGNSNYLPVVEYVSFLFDLMEVALYIQGLIDFANQLIKELPEVENMLASRSSVLCGTYCSSLALFCVGVLRKYHCCLLVSQEQTASVFEGLCKVVKNVTNPTDCSSAERCILVHLYDLYTCCSFLRTKHSEPFSVAYPKVKQTLYMSIQPSALNLLWNTTFMMDYINHPKMKVEKDKIRQLNDNAGHRYSFLCNAIVNICNTQDQDKLNDISILCAELTAACPALSSEWLGVLKALCCSSNHGCGFIDVLTQVDVSDLSIHDSLTVFTAILISRHCFSLQDFVVHVAVSSLLSACPSAGGGDIDAEPGARLTCHILLRLFKTMDTLSLHSLIYQQQAVCSTSSTAVAGGPMSGGPASTGCQSNISGTPGGGPFNSSPPCASISNNTTSVVAGSISGSSTQSISNPKMLCLLKLSCDRHLLAAAHLNITVGAVLAVLKAILVLSDATSSADESKSKVDPNLSGKQVELSISDILGTIDDSNSEMMALGSVNVKAGMGNSLSGSSIGIATVAGSVLESAGLGDFAKHALKQICTQDWVYERCLKDPDILCTQELLLDSMLSNRQAQKLLQLICHPAEHVNVDNTSSYSTNNAVDSVDTSSSTVSNECKQYITRILQNLDNWTLRVSWLQLQLMYKQSQASGELNAWSDSLSRATIDIFQLTSDDLPNGNTGKSNKNNSSGNKCGNSNNGNCNNVNSLSVKTSERVINNKKNNNIWLVAPLIAKLNSTVQGRVLKAAGLVLETGNWSSKAKDKDKNVQRSTSLLSQQPFLSLVLTCLKGQDEQREGLLTSLHSQLSQFLYLARDDKFHPPEEPKARQAMQDSLQLRLSLVGGMFDTIQRSSTIMTDWCLLLVQLISHSIVDAQNNSELFTTVLDMLATLIHSAIVAQSDPSGGEKSEVENKKHTLNVIFKKIKKELSDKNSDAIMMVRQLLPIAKYQCEVIACEAMGSLVDTKGNKIQGFDSIDKKQGLQVAEKHMVSPWDVLEGHKNPAPLSWTWFGAVRMERKPLQYEEAHRQLFFHTHSMKRPVSYFTEPPQLPPEDLEPPPPPQPSQLILPQQPQPPQLQVPTVPTGPQMIHTNSGIVMHPDKTLPHPALMQEMGVKKPPLPTHPQHHPHPGLPPMMDHQSPRGMAPLQIPPDIGTGRGRKPKGPRRKRPRGGAVSAGPGRGNKTTSPVRHMYHDPSGMYGGPHVAQGPQGWYGGAQQQIPGPPPVPQQQQQQQQQGQQSYYSQQPLPPGGPRFGTQLSQSKAALSNMLRQRHPGGAGTAGNGQYISGGVGNTGDAQNPYQNMEMMKQRHQLMQMRAQQQQQHGIQTNQSSSMYTVGAQMQQNAADPQSTPLHHLPPQQQQPQNIVQNSTNYGPTFGNNPSGGGPGLQVIEPGGSGAPSVIESRPSALTGLYPQQQQQSYASSIPSNNVMASSGSRGMPVTATSQQQQYISQQQAIVAQQQQHSMHHPQQSTSTPNIVGRSQYQMTQPGIPVTQNVSISGAQAQQQQINQGHYMQISQAEQNQQMQGPPPPPPQGTSIVRQQQQHPQQMMQAMQQKQQQQQTAELVAQLRGHLSSVGGSGTSATLQPAQQPPQHNPYQQQQQY